MPPDDEVGAVAGIVAADDRLARRWPPTNLIVSAPSLPNSCIEPMLAAGEDAVVLGAAVHRAGIAGLQDDGVVAGVAGDGREAGSR